MTMRPGRRRAATPPLEKVEQARVMRTLRVFGFEVGSTSQARPSRQMVGLPDLVLFHPGLRRGGWWETKRYRHRASYDPYRPHTWEPEPLSAEQRRFLIQAAQCGDLVGWGGHREVEAWLVALGLAQRLPNGSLVGDARREVVERNPYRGRDADRAVILQAEEAA